MTQYWEPGTQYNNGDVVLYEGSRYKIIQPHRSQSDWAPPITPALWGRLQAGDNCDNQYDSQKECCQQPQSCHKQQPCEKQQSWQQQQQQSSYQENSQQSWQSDQKTEERKEEHKWYDVSDDMEKKLKIGGGVAAGAALLAGGAAAYKHHENKKEQEHGRYEHTEQYENSEHSHSKLKIAGGLAAGAALAAGGVAAYKHHENEKHEGSNDVGRYSNDVGKHSNDVGRHSDEEGGHFGWDHLDEDTKKKFKVGGGIAAGVALLAGGVAAYQSHEKSKDEQETHVRQSTDWITIATKRTNEFYSRGPQGPVTWVLTHGKNIPQGAIEVSKERDRGLFISRTFIDGGLQPGKACTDFPKGAVVGYQKEEHHVDTYEILLGEISRLRWERVSGRIHSDSLRPVEGGYENDGTKLFIIKAEFPERSGVFHPGKTSAKLDGAYISYGGTEKNVREYEVLCYR